MRDVRVRLRDGLDPLAAVFHLGRSYKPQATAREPVLPLVPNFSPVIVHSCFRLGVESRIEYAR